MLVLRVTWCLFAIVFLIASADAAVAGTAYVTETTIVYEAAPGEPNDVTIAWTGTNPPRMYEVRDSGAAVLAGPGCVEVDTHAALCTSAPGRSFDEVTIRTDDLADRASTALLCPTCGLGPRPFGIALLVGGPGDDTLIAGDPGNRGSILIGGSGDDMLIGGGFRDVLVGGSGADVMEGGSNDLPWAPDLASYAGHQAAVRVDIDGLADDGAPGEGDNVLPSVEGAIGGSGDDILVGNAGPNTFLGGRGEDRLVGGAGDDRLSGGWHRDVIRAGPGDDDVDGEGGDDWIAGGTGHDTIAGGDLEGVDWRRYEGKAPDPFGDDTIFAGAGRDVIYGHGGADRMDGGRGDDWMNGQRGEDLFIGGWGDDRLFSCRDGSSDRVSGGPGRDEVSFDKRDRVTGAEPGQRCPRKPFD